MPIAIITVVVIAVLGTGLFILTSKNTEPISDTNFEIASRPDNETYDTTPNSTSTIESNTEPINSADGNVVDSTYADGTYSAEASYLTPRRTEQTIEVFLTLDNDIVIAADIIYDELEEGYSNDNQARFDKAYTTEVIGRSLDDIALSRVGSASLTSGAFNEAKAKIATAAAR